MKSSFYILFGVLQLFVCFSVMGQKKIVVMGSSTAAGSDASSYNNSWVGKLTNHFRKNMADGLDTVTYNIAEFGYATYDEMPTGFVPPMGRPLPDPDHNVTKALSFTPDIVIINLPSNDIAFGYTKKEMMDNLRLMSSTIKAAGSKCYIATTQPGNHLTVAQRQAQRELVDSINNNFGIYAVDFWTDLVTNDGQNLLRDEVRAAPSLYHLNDVGHNFLFIRIRDENIFSNAVLPVKLTQFEVSEKQNVVVVKWNTEEQEANTVFEIQRSSNSRDFETIAKKQIAEPANRAAYSETDLYPLQGKSYYRLKIDENGKIIYSAIAVLSRKEKKLGIHHIFYSNSANMIADINVSKDQTIILSVINTSGAVIWKQSMQLRKPYTRITIPTAGFPHGQFYLRVTGDDGETDIKAFIK
jgi:GDSL-like Lipase/Acylhydrolase family